MGEARRGPRRLSISPSPALPHAARRGGRKSRSSAQCRNASLREALDVHCNTVGVGGHFGSRESERHHALRSQIRVASSISIGMRAMVLAVHLDTKARFDTIEIENIRTERTLTPKSHAELFPTQTGPKDALRRRRVLPQLRGTLIGVGVSSVWMHRSNIYRAIAARSALLPPPSEMGEARRGLRLLSISPSPTLPHASHRGGSRITKSSVSA